MRALPRGIYQVVPLVNSVMNGSRAKPPRPLQAGLFVEKSISSSRIEEHYVTQITLLVCGTVTVSNYIFVTAPSEGSLNISDILRLLESF